MRHRRALLLGLLAGLLTGCATVQPVTSVSWLNRLRMFQGPTGPDVVQMDVALVERPLGDSYINDDLWVDVDEHVVPLECKALLEQNGFRVGQIGGITPAGLQSLLTSGRCCANPRRLVLRADNSATLVIGPRIPACQFEIRGTRETAAVDLGNAECILSVVPTLTNDGRVRLRFTPQVRHGEGVLAPRPATDRSGWVLQKHRPVENYGELTFELTLAANQYLVVGGRVDQQKTLGQRSFVRPDEPVPVQRLLVVRTTRSTDQLPVEDSREAAADYSLLSKSPPLAVQAAYSGVRTDRP